MIAITKRMPSVLIALLLMVVVAQAQTQQRPREAFSVQGYSGRTSVVPSQGRQFVDVQELARITNGSLSFEGNRIVLTLPRNDAVDEARQARDSSAFSSAFLRAAIEAMGSMREWGGMLLATVQYGYPVGNNLVGATLSKFQDQTAGHIALASSAASTDSDYRGLELLTTEFTNVKDWGDRFINARNSMSAVNLTTSEHPLQDDQEADKLLRCGQFLSKMFAGGRFQDDLTCR